MDPFLGQIQTFGFNFAPRGWALCSGQLLAISANSALFSLLGTIYGGDGRTTFALPDLRSRTMVHAGQGPGLNNINLGQKSGTEYHTLTTPEMPSHTHAVSPINCVNSDGDQLLPRNMSIAGDSLSMFNDTANSDLSASALSVLPNGGNIPFGKREPFLGMYTSIAIQGIYPSRS
jgi:microcystin-dependent protein